MKRVVPPPSKKIKRQKTGFIHRGGPTLWEGADLQLSPLQQEQSFLIGLLDQSPDPRAFEFLSIPEFCLRYAATRECENTQPSYVTGPRAEAGVTSEAGEGTAPWAGRALGPAGRTARREPGGPPAPPLRPRPGRGPPLAPKVWALAARKRHCKVFSPADGHTTAHIVEGCGYPAARLSVVSPPSCPIRYCLISSAKEPLPGQLSPPSVPHAMAAAQQPRAALLPGTRLPALPQSANTGSRCWQSQDFITTTLTSAGLFVISLLS